MTAVPHRNRLQLEVQASDASVALARRFVARQLCRLGRSDLSDDGALIASELVTNAVREGRKVDPGKVIAVRVVPQPDRTLRIEVGDCSPLGPVPRPAGGLSENGRGLHIVECLADSCGWARKGDGKVVWAVLK